MKLSENIKTAKNYHDISEHEHSHSLYVHCLNCKTFGINMPTLFISAAQCGNCGSMETVKYYPSCCIVADRYAGAKAVMEEAERLAKILVEVWDETGLLPHQKLALARWTAFKEVNDEPG